MTMRVCMCALVFLSSLHWLEMFIVRFDWRLLRTVRVTVTLLLCWRRVGLSRILERWLLRSMSMRVSMVVVVRMAVIMRVSMMIMRMPVMIVRVAVTRAQLR